LAKLLQKYCGTIEYRKDAEAHASVIKIINEREKMVEGEILVWDEMYLQREKEENSKTLQIESQLNMCIDCKRKKMKKPRIQLQTPKIRQSRIL
jgi:hypothetical protein